MNITTGSIYQQPLEEVAMTLNASSINQQEATTSTTSDTNNCFEIQDVYESTVNDTSSKFTTYSNFKTASAVSTATAKAQGAGNMTAPSGSMPQSSANVTAASGSFSDVSGATSSEDSEEETTTEMIYNADGSVYQETTVTDVDGNESVTMTLIKEAVTEETSETKKEEAPLKEASKSTQSE